MGRSNFRSSSVIHDLPKRRFFNDSSVRKVGPMEIETFKNSLDFFIDEISGLNQLICDDRPRFVHAVAVVADPNKQGEVMKATCIKQLDSFHVEVQTDDRNVEIQKKESVDRLIQTQNERQAPLLEQSIENRRQRDEEIETALKILQESKDMLDETAFNIRFPSEVRARKAAIAKNHA
uniref:Uncharacterized protein n=1 Tax=Panagrolaimus sp. JU765 TaxID=591449 RepID=A0AC34RE36_9BILA